jgi:cell division protein FtsI/penicillin-binding protein 2
MLKLFYYSVYNREHYLKEGSLLAWREGFVPAPRGRILDAEGRALAWTEKYFDLYCVKDVAGKIPRRLTSELKKEFSGLLLEDDSDRVLLKRALRPEEIMRLEKYMAGNGCLMVVPRRERVCVDYPGVRELAGKVVAFDGGFRGISGIEAESDKELSGEKGIYIVMLDRNGKWVENTWRMLKAPVPGGDVSIKRTLNQLKGGK